jgi:hypothetical protein
MDDKRTKKPKRSADNRARPQRGQWARGAKTTTVVRDRKNPAAESSGPFTVFQEWSSEADERAYGKL